MEIRRIRPARPACSDVSSIDAEMVMYRLNEAGKTLMSLPNKGTRPAGFGSGWPDVVHEVMQAYGYTEARQRTPVPSPQAITRMDEAFTWLRFVPDDRKRHRRIVLMRSLIHPVTERHHWSWRRIGDSFGWSHEAVRNWYNQGVDWIVDAMRAESIAASKIVVDTVDNFAHSNVYNGRGRRPF